jgi:hypothetical protein
MYKWPEHTWSMHNGPCVQPMALLACEGFWLLSNNNKPSKHCTILHHNGIIMMSLWCYCAVGSRPSPLRGYSVELWHEGMWLGSCDLWQCDVTCNRVMWLDDWWWRDLWLVSCDMWQCYLIIWWDEGLGSCDVSHKHGNRLHNLSGELICYTTGFWSDLALQIFLDF